MLVKCVVSHFGGSIESAENKGKIELADPI